MFPPWPLYALLVAAVALSTYSGLAALVVLGLGVLVARRIARLVTGLDFSEVPRNPILRLSIPLSLLASFIVVAVTLSLWWAVATLGACFAAVHLRLGIQRWWPYAGVARDDVGRRGTRVLPAAFAMALIAWIVHAEWPTPVKHPPLDAAALAVADGYSRDVARHDRRGADRLSRGPAGYPLVQFDGVWKAGPFRRWRRTDRTLHTVTYHYARRTAVGCVTADETLELGTVGAKWYVVRLIDSSSETQTPSPDRCA